MPEEKFKRNGKIYFGVDDIPERTESAVRTLTEVINCYNDNSHQDDAFNQKRNEAVDDLRAICHNTFGPSANVYIFGSCINGFGTKSSDVDCFVMSNYDLKRKNTYFNPLRDSLKRNSSPFTMLNFVRRGNHPILTVKHKKNAMELDVTFSSNHDPKHDVLENSALLNTYAQKNIKVPAVGRFIKYVLSKEPSLGSAKIGGLSSYGHILMYINFLLHGKHKINHVIVKPPYIKQEETIVASEGEIFLDFLRFYACELDSSMYAIDIRDFDLKKVTQKMDRSIFTLEDPIIEKNLGRTMSPKRVYELKLFYYHLLCTLSDHDMSDSQLMDFINELGDLGLSQKWAPSLHPFCESDIEKPNSRQKKRDNKPRRKGSESNPEPNENSNQQTSVGSPSKTDVQASNKKTPTKKNKRHNEKKETISVKETIIVHEEGVIIQNDPYLLEDMMKEIETPEKGSSQPQNNHQKLIDVRSETANLTKAMIEENNKLEVKSEWDVVHYKATDVMGDSRCLVAVPLLAALGFKVPSIQVGNNVSLEKLKCIPGFNPELSRDQMNSMMEDIGCFVGYSQDLNLVESKMNMIMKSVGTLSSSQLDLARYFSLIAACGSTYYFGDMKCVGRGIGKRETVFKQANDITSLTKQLGIKCRVQVSDATVPYSKMLGYPLEIQDVIEILSGEGSSDVVEVLALQCAHLLQMSKKVESLKEGEKMVFEVLSSGGGLKKFLEMLAVQGVSRDVIDKLRAREYEEVFTLAGYQTTIESRIPGIIRDIRLDNLERVVTNRLGGYGSGGQGIKICANISSRVNVGTCLAVIYHTEETLAPKIKSVVNTAFEIEKIHFNRVIRTFRNDESEKKQQRRNRNSKSGSKENADKEDNKDDKEGSKDGVGSSVSSDSVPKDYVVVVNTEDGEQRTVTEKKE